MKLIDKINNSALFAQSALSAATATKDSLGRDITATYLTGISLPESATWSDTSNVVQSNSAQWAEGGTGDEEVNSFVYNNSATINEVNSAYQTHSASYQPSGNYIPYTATSPITDFETNSGLDINRHYNGILNSTYLGYNAIQISYIDSRLNDYSINDYSVLSNDKLKFITNSDSAYVDREKIHTWDSASNYIQTNSATWADTSNVVQTNSAQWAEGGGTLTGDAQGAIDLVYSNSGNIITGTKRDYDFTAGNVTKVTFGNFTINGVRNYIKYERPGYPTDDWFISNDGFHLGPTFADGYFEQYARVYLERTGLSSMSGSKSDKKLIWRALLDTDVEGANNTITAIAGSAIAGETLSGEFVPQSAFDELKQSYDALSSLFATYSGQWLLPNEGV